MHAAKKLGIICGLLHGNGTCTVHQCVIGKLFFLEYTDMIKLQEMVLYFCPRMVSRQTAA